MKRILFSFICLLSGLQLFAGPVTRQEAQSLAKDFLASKGIAMTTSMAYRAPRKATFSKTDNAYYYVFNAGNNNGYVIVSGDDRTEEVLGYTDSGTFDAETAPDNLKSMLQRYVDEIKLLDADSVVVTSAQKAAYKAQRRKTEAARHAVAPLLTSLWNQGDPYNRMSPIYYKEDRSGVLSGNRSATGCVATAIAQVINYYKYPAVTKAEIPSYSFDSYGTTITMPAIPAGTKIDWDNMRDTYSSSNTDAEKDAVANLMLIVGCGCKMSYGPSSGAVTAYGENVLKNYLGFDDAAHNVVRSDYNIDEWINLIYKEISSGHPTVYGGFSSGGGHAFVLDGYESDDLFHVNWGWGGLDNGYFRISVLHPDSNNGIGASNTADGYSMGQDAILGVNYPDDVPASNTSINDDALTSNDVTLDGRNITTNFINWTGSTGDFSTGIGYIDANGAIVPVNVCSETDHLEINHYRTPLRSYWIPKLPVGTYKIVPISKRTTSNEWKTSFNVNKQYFLYNVTASSPLTYTLTYLSGNTADLAVNDWNFTGDLVKGNKQEVKATFTNEKGPQEYYGTIYSFASLTSTKGASTSHGGLTVRIGGTETNSFFFTPDAVGKYNIWLTTDADGNNVIASTTVDVTETAAQNVNLKVSNISYSNVTNKTIYGNFISASATITNNSTTAYNGAVDVKLWRGDVGVNSYRVQNTQEFDVSLAAGESHTYTFVFDDLAVDYDYDLSFIYASKATGNLDGGGLYSSNVRTLRAGVVRYTVAGAKFALAPTASIRVTSQIAALDMTGCTGINTITTSANTNTVYVVDANAAIPAGLDGANVVHGNEAAEINLTDNYPFIAPRPFVAKKISYSRVISKGSTGTNAWEALVLPFAPTEVAANGTPLTLKQNDTDNGNFYVKEFSQIDDNKNVDFAYVSSMKANIPYVVKIAQGDLVGNTFTFSATDADIDATSQAAMNAMSSAYTYTGITYNNSLAGIYTMNADGTAFTPVTKTTTVKAFRGYFTSKLDDTAKAATIPIENDVTGINNVASDMTDGTLVNVFGIDGKQVGQVKVENGTINLKNLPKGVYIVKGKKIIL
jgi:hypothetical protein